MICSYGCGNEAIITFKNGKHCCMTNQMQCPAIRKKNSRGVLKSYKSGNRPKYVPSKDKVECKFCKKLITKYNILKHEKACAYNPKNINYCPICSKVVSKGCITCSQECRYIYFGAPNYIEFEDTNNYRRICFHYHGKKCIICGEYHIIEIHHFDENHDNNEKENLIPLCPTHHKYMHSKYINLILSDVIDFVMKQYKHMWE